MLEKIFNLVKKIKRVFFPFYKDKELKFVFQKLQEGLPNDKIAARFVGGCVRKYLSNDDIDDIDIATTLSSEEIKERFNNTNFRIVDTGIEHGTITLVSTTLKFVLLNRSLISSELNVVAISISSISSLLRYFLTQPPTNLAAILSFG